MNLPFGDGFVPLIYCDFGSFFPFFPQVPCLICRVERFYPSGETDLWFFSHFPTASCVDTVQEKWVHDFLSLDSVQMANMCWFGTNLGCLGQAKQPLQPNILPPIILHQLQHQSLTCQPTESVRSSAVVWGLILRPNQASSLLSSVFGWLYVIKNVVDIYIYIYM